MEKIAVANPAVEYPLLTDRIQSSFIDGMLIIVMMFVFSGILERYENAPDWLRIGLFFGLWAVYEPLCTTMGATIGNYIKGIRVRQNGAVNQRINFFQAFIRYVFKMLLGWVSFLTIHSNPQKRAIHDIVAGSVMIRK